MKVNTSTILKLKKPKYAKIFLQGVSTSECFEKDIQTFFSVLTADHGIEGERCHCFVLDDTGTEIHCHPVGTRLAEFINLFSLAIGEGRSVFFAFFNERDPITRHAKRDCCEVTE